eukprot:scaffold13781_cov93-Phaeocystis_antarctica.AAC.2
MEPFTKPSGGHSRVRRRQQNLLQLSEQRGIECAVEALALCEREQVSSIAAHLAVHARLEVEDVVGRIAIDPTLWTAVRHPAAAHAKAVVANQVQCVRRLCKFDCFAALARKFALRSARHPLQVAADVVG